MKTYMTRKEMMQYFAVNADTLSDWQKQGLVVCKVGKRVYYKDADVSKFLDGHRECRYERS